MRYRDLGKTGLKVSEIGLGAEWLERHKAEEVKAYVVDGGLKEITLHLGALTDTEREIIMKGCLINYYRGW